MARVALRPGDIAVADNRYGYRTSVAATVGQQADVRMNQLLRLKQLRSTYLTSVEATVRALLVARALQEGITGELRAHLPTGTPTTPRAVSSWGFGGLGLDTLRQQVQGPWSQTRLRACLQRLRRFLVLPPRHREHQETAVRAWLKGRQIAQGDDRPAAA